MNIIIIMNIIIAALFYSYNLKYITQYNNEQRCLNRIKLNTTTNFNQKVITLIKYQYRTY